LLVCSIIMTSMIVIVSELYFTKIEKFIGDLI
jgi:hypothetical protein